MADGLIYRELIWREYNLHVELYKYHMEIALKANMFFYAITGGKRY